jgi:hypothetical protein
MALVQALLAAVFRSFGKILNTAFGWATLMLFGKVSQKRQTYLSVITFGSVLWFIAALGVAVPRVAAFLLAFVTLPEWVEPNWVRLGMLAVAIVLPLVIGVCSILMLEPAARPQGAGAKIKAVLKGYPYALGLALTLLTMLIFAPIIKLHDTVRRWTSTHIPVIVKSKDYLDVVGDVERILKDAQLNPQRTPAGWMLRLPTKILTFFAGGAIDDLVAEQLTVLRAEDCEVLLHPSDLVIRGRERQVARVHALVTEHLTFTKAYLTWTKEAQQLEDRLGKAWQAIRADELAQARPLLVAVERDLRRVELSYEEWEVLFRELLVVERARLRRELRDTGEAYESPEPASSPAERLEEGVAAIGEAASIARRHPALAATVAGLCALRNIFGPVDRERSA